MSRLVCVAAYDRAFDAYAVKGAIEEAGIPVAVEGELTAAGGLGVTPLSPLVRVIVPEEHAARAREVVAAWDAAGARAYAELRAAGAAGGDDDDEDDEADAEGEAEAAEEKGAEGAPAEGGTGPGERRVGEERADESGARRARGRRLAWTLAVLVLLALWAWYRGRR